MNRLIAAIFAAALSFATFYVHAADLVIDVQGATEAKGQIVVAVYGQAEGWLRKPVKLARVDAVAGSNQITVADLPEGAYAISLYHDLDGNGRLDVNAMRVPTEPWGFSNDAVGMFGPASFEDARFVLPAEGKRIAVQLKS